MDEIRKHLDFIQAVIARLANNSFALKGWSVTVVVALLALVGQGPEKVGSNVLLLALIPAFAFWWLDAACLRRERLFRCLYDEVRLREQTDYSMNASHLADAVGPTWRVALSSSLSWFYGPVAGAAVGFWIMRNIGLV